jgi:ABC-type nitrate/sulfonate/bicarbonate transport system permease component
LVAGAVLLLEAASRLGWINPVSFIPPSKMAAGAWSLLSSGQFNKDIGLTVVAAFAAAALATVFGFLGGLALHRLPRVLRVLNPLLLSYYAVPIFVVYPMFIVLFGINRLPLIAIGFVFAIVAMAVNTLNGLQRVPRVLLRTAHMSRMSPFEEMRQVTIPASLPYLFTGVKLVVVYSFIAVIGGEFVLSGEGIGYQIAFAYNNFDNQTMYGLMLLLLVFVGSLNLMLHVIEQRLYQRRVLREAT